MNLHARFAAILAAAVLVALVACAFIADRVGREARSELGDARETYLLGTMRSAAESGLATGLVLEQLGTLQSLAEREKADAPQVLAIDVFSPAGVLVFSTDRGMVGTPVAPEWTRRLREPGAWRVDGPEEHVLLARFDNELGEPAGGIALTIAKPADAALPAWLALAGTVAAAVAVGAAIAAVLAWLAIWRLLAPHARAARLLEGATVADGGAGEDRLVAAARRARARWEAADGRIERGLLALKEIDHAD